MAIKTFTTGEVLTAADTNTYLANSGLVYIKSQTIGNGVSSVAVTSAFSADYDRYKITVTGGVNSLPMDMRLTLGSTSTGYYGFLTYGNYTSNTVLGFAQSNTAFWGYVGTGSSDALFGNSEVDNPFATKRTFVTAQNPLAVTTGASNTFGGYLDNNTSYTGFTIATNQGTMTGGTITVYGYRKA
jgi:hypothetical protein